MASILCPHCLQPLELPLHDICQHCGRSLENGNPNGALPFGTLLGGRYTIGDYITADGDGLCYQGVENARRRFVRIKEFFPVTLCNGRRRDGALLPKEGYEVLFKTSLMDFKDLYEDLKNLTPTEGLSQILDVREENNTVYAVEESYKGMTLTHYLSLRPRPMPPAEACEMLRPVMHGVAALHKAGLIHRGISPENILLPIDGAARLTGYGTLALRTRGSELKSQLYPGYAAPEQYSAAEFAGRYTDVYALAAVIYRMVTNQKPAPAPQRVNHDTLESAHSLESGVPPYFAQVLACALRMEPTKRMQTVQELETALEDPNVASAMFDKGDGQVSTKKLIGVGLAVGFVLVALALWALLGSGGAAAPSGGSGSTEVPSAQPTVPAAELVDNLVGKNYRQEIEGSTLYTGYRIVASEEYSDTVAEGLVIRQEPLAGTVKQPDQTLTLYISLGPRLAELPGDIIGKTQEEATKKLDEMGVKYTTQDTAADPLTGLEMPVTGEFIGQVVGSDPEPGKEFDPEKTTVTLYVAAEHGAE